MKALLLLFGILNCMVLPSESYNQPTMTKKEVKSMKDNNIGKFVRLSGSEEKAIDKLIVFCLSDTLYNRDNKSMIWYIKTPQKIIEEDYYASRKLQAFYWILKIYHSDYSSQNNKSEFCEFMNDSGETIWDYKDLDITKKAYYYQVIITSPVEHKTYYNDLGYIKLHNKSYKGLEGAFVKWNTEMKINGLQYMRKNNIQPVDSTNYVIKTHVSYSMPRLKKRMK